MNNALKTTVIIVLLLLPNGCRQKGTVAENVLSINPNEADPSFSLSELVDTISYIKLETNENSMMAFVREIIIKNKYIYALDRNLKAVFVFDRKGNFVSKLDKHGEGPDEYGIMYQVLVDDDEEYIEVFDYKRENSRIIKYTNITFEPLEDRPISLPSANTMRKEKDGDIYYFSTQQQENFIDDEVTNADIIAVKDGNVQYALFKKKIITGDFTFSPNTESFTTNDKGEIFVSLMYNNTFFRLSNIEAYPVLTVDFGRYGIDNSVGLKSTKEQQEYLYADNSFEGLAFFPVLNANNSKMLAFSYYFKDNSKIHIHHYIDLKNNDRIFHVRDIVNDITGFPDKVYLCSYSFSINHEVFHDGYLVDIILPSNHIKDKDMEIPGIGKVDREDNPIIMMMKLKERWR